MRRTGPGNEGASGQRPATHCDMRPAYPSAEALVRRIDLDTSPPAEAASRPAIPTRTLVDSTPASRAVPTLVGTIPGRFRAFKNHPRLVRRHLEAGSRPRVENDVHEVRDRTLGEEGCRVKLGPGPKFSLAATRRSVSCGSNGSTASLPPYATMPRAPGELPKPAGTRKKRSGPERDSKLLAILCAGHDNQPQVRCPQCDGAKIRM